MASLVLVKVCMWTLGWCDARLAAVESEFHIPLWSIQWWRSEIKESWSSEGVPETSSSLTALPTLRQLSPITFISTTEPPHPYAPARGLHTRTLRQSQRIWQRCQPVPPPTSTNPHSDACACTDTYTHTHTVAHQKPMAQKTHSWIFFGYWKSPAWKNSQPREKVSCNLNTKTISHH